MKPAFIVNNRNKAPLLFRCVKGALSQTVACHIIIADFASTDNSRAEIERALKECQAGADHDVEFIKSDEPTVSSMSEMNRNLFALVQKTNAEWIFQCSSDDYSFPARVAVCMKAVGEHACDAVATTQFYEDPAKPGERMVSGYPTETGYVKAGDGLLRLAYGSCIAAYSREFLEKVGSAGANTPDVYWGFLAALGKGFYAVANPQHVHCNVSDIDNVGFQGKLAGAAGDDLARLNELNHFQLARLYFDMADKVMELYPQGIDQADWNAVMQAALNQSRAWLHRRIELHDNKITPGIM